MPEPNRATNNQASGAPGVLLPDTTTHILLDIEGTTCPVSFVSEVLFPYARSNLASFLKSQGQQPAVIELVQELQQAWDLESDPEAVQLRRKSSGKDPEPGTGIATEPAIANNGNRNSSVTASPGSAPSEIVNNQTSGSAFTGEFNSSSLNATRIHALVPYLEWLIHQDRKLTPLKELQGLIWEHGYANGSLQGPIYADVPPALRDWKNQGLQIAVYSSGSVRAQQLIYQYSCFGDLRPWFSAWFDTRIGAKQRAESYRSICTELQTDPSRILFISDVTFELDAAAEAGYAVLISEREGNPPQPCHPYTSIKRFDAIRSIMMP
ncbi:acireductone synthase [Synechococcus sp. CBW1006]|uniref:acireductone synthase n=1 Tax=Synechococcus sp. CBW1006 TaxID=1353138 RepID=UPI0018CF37E5|nr:acireductone synthase [Synechococcus sp. CBW1006]QPN68189.1 acireductone synthase [Synechococcus sp. CBW1006]